MCLLQPLACYHIQVTPVRRTDAVYLPCTLKKKEEIIDLSHAAAIFFYRRFKKLYICTASLVARTL